MAGLCLAALLGVASCQAPAPDDGAHDEVQALLDRRAEAVVDRDARAYRATQAPGKASGGEFDRVGQVPLSAWKYRLTDLERSGAHATAGVELSFRIGGYDRAPVTVQRTLRLDRRADRWYVADERAGKDAGEQLWEQGDVVSVTGRHSLVLGVGRSRAKLREYADLADRAVPAVQDAWGRDWPGRVVILVPESLDDMGDLLGAPAAGYRGIAAVTTGETGGADRAPADRVVLNPDAFDVLGSFGRQVVLTHETTHVATRAATSKTTPMWLSEGFADWVGYRGSGRGAAQAAPETKDAVERGEVPEALPADDDFGFEDDPEALARAYEGGWLACRMIAERWGESELLDFYRAVGDSRARSKGDAVEHALRDVLDTTPQDFTARWREYVRGQVR
ncbi:hypothetical protein DSC45_10025 [Streptomyces sp. YIM 130001]|nr:hypothetical protein DSC45_10025 [Streptomyces sp. YIM 130001]